ncbi:hypothetical protein FGF04_38660, partial [Streptomyces apricus]
MRPGGGGRRDVLRGVLAATAAVALTPFVAASGPSRTGPPHAPAGRAGGGSGGEPGSGSCGPGGSGAESAAGFDEVYRGCRIRGRREPAGGAHPAGAAYTAAAWTWRVTVDERPLHLMRRADGGYLTMIDHYRSYPTPLAAARAAVDELGGPLRLRAPAAEAEPGQGQG